jgi:hypothetical protein
MAEYRRCAQGRRSVDEYHEEFLELRSVCASKGDDLSQKVQFLSGVNPELAVLVKQSLATFPKASLDQTVELARNLSELVPNRFAGVRIVHDDEPPFSPRLSDSDVECFNCFEFGHDAHDCTNLRLERRPVRNGDLDEDGDKQSPAPSPAQSPRRTFVNSIRCFGIRFSGQQESVPDSLKAVLNDGDESSEHSNEKEVEGVLVHAPEEVTVKFAVVHEAIKSELAVQRLAYENLTKDLERSCRREEQERQTARAAEVKSQNLVAKFKNVVAKFKLQQALRMRR